MGGTAEASGVAEAPLVLPGGVVFGRFVEHLHTLKNRCDSGLGDTMCSFSRATLR